jgi:murein DD-endopeptidase MepM/ murein hydrolase activator NlpD
MKFFRIIFTLLVVLSAIQQAFAQPGKRGNSEFSNVKTPEISTIKSDTSVIHIDEGDEFDDYSDATKSVFDPRKKLNITSEDTSSFSDNDISIVEETEEMKLDCVWVKISEHFAVWDSRSVNPYRIDHSRFNDTVNITLYDSTQSRYWSMPVKKTAVTSDFGTRKYRWHYGTDLELDIGDSIFASFDGIIRISKFDAGGYGNYVMVRHYNGLETLYGHLTASLVQVGQYVKAGELIGWGGNTGRSTGPHLHFEVRFEGTAIDAEYFYDFEEEQLISRNCLITGDNFQYLNRARKVYYHKIGSGETLSEISRKYKVPASRLCKLNGISMRSTLKVGRKLRIR